MRVYVCVYTKVMADVYLIYLYRRVYGTHHITSRENFATRYSSIFFS